MSLRRYRRPQTWNGVVFAVLCCEAIAPVGVVHSDVGNTAIPNDALHLEIQAVDSLLRSCDFRSARLHANYIMRLLEIPVPAPDSLKAVALVAAGQFYFDMAEHDLCEDAWSRAGAILERLYDSTQPERIDQVFRMASLSDAQSRFEEAEQGFERAYRLASATYGPDDPASMQMLIQLAAVMNTRGSYAAADSILHRVLDVLDPVADDYAAEIADCYHNLAYISLRELNYDEAEQRYLTSLKLREEALGPDHIKVAHSTGNLFLVHFKQRHYDTAEAFIQRTIAIYEKTTGEQHPEFGVALNNLAALYWLQGRFADAEPVYRRALAIQEAALGPDHLQISYTLNNLAVLARKLGDLEEAESLMKRSTDIRRKQLGADHPDVAASLANLAGLYVVLARHEEADSLLRETITIWEANFGESYPDIGHALKSLGDMYLTDGRLSEAEASYLKALKLWRDGYGNDYPELSFIVDALARTKMAQGDYPASLAYFEDLLQRRRRLIQYVFSISSEEQKRRWLEQFPLVSNGLLHLAERDSSTATRSMAEEMLLNGKCTVVDAFMRERRSASCAYDAELAAALDQLESLKSLIAGLTLRTVGRRTPRHAPDSLSGLLRRQDSLESAIAQRCADYDADRFGDWVRVQDVARALPDGAVFWDIVRRKGPYTALAGSEGDASESGRYMGFVTTPDAAIRTVELGSTRTIDSLVRAVRRAIYDDGPHVASPLAHSLESRYRETARMLYDSLFAPLAAASGGRTYIIVSPDGPLQLLPLGVLPTSDSAYAIEDFRIRYVSAGRDLLSKPDLSDIPRGAMVIADPEFDAFSSESPAPLVQNVSGTDKPGESRALSFGACLETGFPPLRHAREEGTSVADALNGRYRVEVYYGPSAREERLKQLTESPAVLHLATHGYFCDADDAPPDPLLHSAVILAGANQVLSPGGRPPFPGEDGVLTALEISELNLRGTGLVVLSACETGVGETQDYEGVLGLRRAFEQAGAGAVIMSLWKVPDAETAQLMSAFYRTWLDGSSLLDALRTGALTVLAENRQQLSGHPYLWGGFILAERRDFRGY